MTILDSAILGAVEGLTEFLPVSSSGHLILMRDLLNVNTSGGLAFDAILQLGAILAVFLYFRRDVWMLLCDFVRIVVGKGRDVTKENKTLILGLIIGTVPALILGIALQKTMETVFRSAFIVAIMLILGSILFIIAERKAKQIATATTVKQSFWIGCFQTLALIPGVSRSGSTISGGLLFGLTRESAARFSFLLSLPIITGSGLKMLYDAVKHGTSIDATWLQLGIGFVFSFAIGLACIRFLMRYLKTHTLMAFVWYRLALAALVLFVVLVK